MGNFNNENLIPFTGELKPGQRLLKRPDGYFIPVGASSGSNVVAGYFADKDGNGLKFYPTGSNNGESVNQIMIADTGENEPEYEGGNSMDFYKCNSVDTTNQTWTGYKAVFDAVTGTYSFESSATTSLTYGAGFTPVVGKIYTDGVLVQLANLYEGIPVDDLIFYASLAESEVTASTGQALSEHGSVTFSSDFHGIPCGRFDNSWISFTPDNFPSNNFTLAAWYYKATNDSNDASGFFGYGSGSRRAALMEEHYDEFCLEYDGGRVSSGITINRDTWYHLAVVVGTSQVKFYVNGQIRATVSYSANVVSSNGAIGSLYGSYNSHCYVASARIYGRALIDTEIATLASEFTPIVS